MHHFFVDKSRIGEHEIRIGEADRNHIRNVLRMKPGERITVSSGGRLSYTCRIKEYTEEAVVPMATKRAVVRLEGKKEETKRRRWQGIAESAAKQAKRMIIPEIFPVRPFKEAAALAEKLDVRLIPYELAEDMAHTREIFSNISPGQSVGLFIGPEGGFAPEEIEEAVTRYIQPITLGRRILRTETAGIAALSVLMYLLER